MKIAICDDQEIYRKNIKEKILKFLKLLNITGSIFEYESGNSLLIDILNKKFDLIILDIIMDELDGISTARAIRILDKDVEIVFLSRYEEYAIKGYGLNVCDYLLKNENEDKLKEIIHKISKNKRNRTIVLKMQKEIVSFDINQIYFFEVNNRIITVHYDAYGVYKTKEFYSKLDEVEKQLKEEAFYRSHRSYLVNIKKIRKIASKEIYFNVEARAMVSRNKYLELKEIYLNYNIEI